MMRRTVSRFLPASLLVVSFMLIASAAVRAGDYGSSGNFTWGSPGKRPNVASQPNVVAGKVVPYAANFKLNVIDIFGGACPDGFYAGQCLSGDCTCFVFSGTGSSEIFGTTSNAVAEITVDFEDQPGDPDGTCFPGLGFVFAPGTRDIELIDFVGAACNNFGGTSTFTGGWEFNEISSLIFDAQGNSANGIFTGPEAFSFNLRGKACKGSSPCF